MSYERTLIEKSLALLTCITNFFSHVEAKARFSVKEKERHFYDIHRLFEKFKAESGSMASEEFLNIFRSAVEMDGRIYGSQNYMLVNGLPNLEVKIEHFLNIQFQNEYKFHYNSSPIYYGTRLAAEEILGLPQNLWVLLANMTASSQKAIVDHRVWSEKLNANV